MKDPIISVSGLRGVVGDTLTPAVAFRYATAFAGTLPPGPVVVTRDGRANGPALVAPIVRGLVQGSDRQVFDGGIAATPTTGVLVRQLGCAGGIQISASHNPAEYNGMKLFSAAGRVVPATAGAAVLERYRSLDAGSQMRGEERGARSECGARREARGARSECGARREARGARREERVASCERLADTVSAHLALVERTVDVERIRARRLRVLLDANHGSGSVLGRPLLERLGCDVTVLGDKPDGQFAHLPEPTAENLATVVKKVAEVEADIGFCQDPDADRLAIIDERGRYIGEEYTLAICVDQVLRSTLGPVVTNCSSSRMTEDLARKYHVPFYRSAVGEANVVDEMLKRNAILGGEGNGGVIDPRVVLVRDSFVSMALVLAAMAERQLLVSALADELPRYAIHKTKVSVARERIAPALDALERHFADASADRLDGLRLDFAHADGSSGWLLVRASNTEPIVRIIAEAATLEEASDLCTSAADVILGVN